MNWSWRKALGLESKAIGDVSVLVDGLPSRQDGTNFRTNQVTLAQYDDALGAEGQWQAATWACVNLIAGTISSLPLVIYQDDKDGVRVVAKDHPLYFVLHDSPNFDQSPLEFWEYQAAAIELHGNAYAEIERHDDGRIRALKPLRPGNVSVKRKTDGHLEYSWTENNNTVKRGAKDVLHVRGPMSNGTSGVSTVAANAGTFQGAKSVDRASRTIFNNGMRPSGVLSTDSSIALTGEQRAALEGHLDEKFQGAMNAGRPLLLDRGMKWQQLNITPEDAEMLESRKFSGEEICRLFGVPPAMVGYGDKSSNWGTGKEVDVLGFLKFTMTKRLKRIEQSLMKQLLTPADRAKNVRIEFNQEGLLRGDSMGRAQFYEIMKRTGVMTTNECRAKENLPPVEGGDVVTVQMQDVPLSEAVKPQKDDGNE